MKMIVVCQLIAILIIARAPQIEAFTDANGKECFKTTLGNLSNSPNNPVNCCPGYSFKEDNSLGVLGGSNDGKCVKNNGR